MATREDYRDSLKNKLLALLDSEAGDFDFSDVEYDLFLELSMARLFPSLYQRKVQSGVVCTTYDSGVSSSASATLAERVYMVEDSTSREALTGWQVRAAADEIIGIPLDGTAARTVNLHYYDAVLMPSDDITDVGIGDEYLTLVVLGAVIEALETAQDVPHKNAPQYAAPSMAAVIDRLSARYERLREDMAMALPGMVLM